MTKLATLCLMTIVFFAPSLFAQDLEMLRAKETPANAVRLESLNLDFIHQGFGKPHVGLSIIDKPLTLKGTIFPHGLGSHAPADILIDLKGVATRFVSMVGVDDETNGKGSIAFKVYVDGKEAASTGVMHCGDEPKLLSADLTGGKTLYIFVSEAGDGNGYDHADFGGAMILLKPGATEKPETIAVGNEPPTPIASSIAKPEPAIHGPKITGATPGRPFLFLIPATGDGPLTFEAKNLPDGLALDAKTGIISGALAKAGSTDVDLTARGPKGEAHRKLTIVGGDHKLALTPPMGWNSWYVWMVSIDDAKMRAAADGLVSSGLAAHGYQYVAIDDTWEGDHRGPDGDMTTNRKFPDMKALGDYIHAKGLKFGIYTSPGKKTCGGYTGSYQHEQQDANTFAEWGVDLLKHDWCSYESVKGDNSLESLKKPYRLMRECLDKCGRDMVYSLCQYGMGDVWKWGTEVGANMWRTTGDMGNSWEAMAEIGFGQNGKEAYAGPGHWNDPDMIVIGQAGWGGDVKQSPLTPNEQITYVSLWYLLSVPLLISCDVSDMDQFTKDLLMNDEMIDVNQDPLGKQASRKAKDGWSEVWSKEMADGTRAVGLFNRGPFKTDITAKWAGLGITGKQPIRDLWAQKDLPECDNAFTASVPAHGAVVVRIGKPNCNRSRGSECIGKQFFG